MARCQTLLVPMTVSVNIQFIRSHRRQRFFAYAVCLHTCNLRFEIARLLVRVPDEHESARRTGL